jgi:UDP-glucose 4-epimerase
MAKVLVTGGAGMIGRRLVRALEVAGHEGVSYDLAYGDDVMHLIQLVHDMNGCDAVFHLAAHYVTTTTFYAEPDEVLRVGIEGTANVLRAAKLMRVKDFVYASSAEVYGEPLTVPTPETEPLKVADPLNPRFSYAISKIAGEGMVLNAKGFRKVQVFRPHNVFGSESKPGHVIPDFISQSRNGGIVIRGTGFETRAFCHVDDIVTGILTMWQRGEGGIYHIGNDTETNMMRLAVLIQGHGAECRPDLLAPGSPKRRCPDISKMRSLGWAPQIGLEDGIRQLLEQPPPLPSRWSG